MTEILSRQNAKFKYWQSLLDSRGIKKAQAAILPGRKITAEFLQQRPGQTLEILLPPKSTSPDPTLTAYRLGGELFNELDTLGTKAPLLVVRTIPLHSFDPAEPQGLEMVVSLSDPGNLGAVLRSAEAFAVRRVILTAESCSPFLQRALRAASGATFRLNMVTTGPLRELKLPSAYGLHMEGESLITFRWPKDLYLVLGEEGQGLPLELGLKRIQIPMAGELESLNAMAAASIALFSYRAQRPFES